MASALVFSAMSMYGFMALKNIGIIDAHLHKQFCRVVIKLHFATSRGIRVRDDNP